MAHTLRGFPSQIAHTIERGINLEVLAGKWISRPKQQYLVHYQQYTVPLITIVS